jgi:hypothetical protein
MLIRCYCARPKGIEKNGSCSTACAPLVLYEKKKEKKKKVKMVTDQGTWTKGPFVKKTFLSFSLRSAAVYCSKYSTTKTSAKGAEQMSCETFRTKLYFCNILTAAHKTAELKKEEKNLR